MGFEIDACFTRALAVLKLHGELDLTTVEHVDWAVSRAIENKCRLVVLDLTDVFFIDCAGLGALVAAAQQLVGSSGDMVLQGVGPQASRLLDLTGTARFFDVVERRTAPVLVS